MDGTNHWRCSYYPWFFWWVGGPPFQKYLHHKNSTTYKDIKNILLNNYRLYSHYPISLYRGNWINILYPIYFWVCATDTNTKIKSWITVIEEGFESSIEYIGNTCRIATSSKGCGFTFVICRCSGRIQRIRPIWQIYQHNSEEP